MNEGAPDYTDLYYEKKTETRNTTKQGAVGVGSGRVNYLIFIEQMRSVIKSSPYSTIEQMDWEAENPDASKQIKGEDK